MSYFEIKMELILMTSSRNTKIEKITFLGKNIEIRILLFYIRLMQNCTIVMTQNVFRPSLFSKCTINFIQSTLDFSPISL